MAKATPHDQLAAAIDSILEEYADGVTITLKDAVKQVTKEGVKALKKESASKFGNGPYAKSWRSVYESDRLSSQGTIYSTKPGLPHLLENGHMLRNGRFWQGKPHISSVEDQIEEEFEKEVMKGL